MTRIGSLAVAPLAALALLGAAALPLRAQEPATTPFVEQVEVRVINVDVVVLDQSGIRVTGLQQGDFEVLENGKPVEITNFSAYGEEPISAGDPTATLPDTGAGAAEAEAETPPAPPVTWAFFVDQMKMDPGVRNHVLKQLATFSAHSIRDGDRALTATYDGLSLKVLSPLGPAAEAVASLTEAQKKLGTPAVGQMSMRKHYLLNQMHAIAPGSRTMAVDAQSILDEIDAIAEEEALRTRESMQAFADLFAILSGIEGRIALVLVGGGYETQPGEELYRQWQAKFGANVSRPSQQLDRRSMDARRDFSRLLDAASRGRITVYSIQAGQKRGSDVSAETSGEAGFVSQISGIDPTGLIEGSTVAAFSTATGGRTFNSGGDLVQRLELAREDLDTYYSLGYRPAGALGESRKIDVRVRREGLRVLHRAAVSEASWRDRTGDSAVTALLADAVPDPVFGAEIEIGAPGDKKGLGKARLVPVTVNVPLRGVTLLPDGAEHQGRLYFQFAVRDPDGGYRRLEARPLDFRIPNDKVATAITQHVAFRIEVKLVPGTYRVAAAILDELGGVTGVATAPLVLAKK